MYVLTAATRHQGNSLRISALNNEKTITYPFFSLVILLITSSYDSIHLFNRRVNDYLFPCLLQLGTA